MLRTSEVYSGHTLVLYGASYIVSGSTKSVDADYESFGGGKGLSVTLFAIIRKSLLPAQLTADLAAMTADSDIDDASNFTPPPRSGVRCKFDQVDYRIHRVTDMPGAFRLELRDPDHA